MPTIIADRYELGQSIGIGGMAEVFVATDQMLDRQVAIKILNRAYAAQPEFVERFKREARAAASLDHPNVVPIYDWGETEDSYYIAMAYVQGESLKDRLRSTGPLPDAEVLRLVTDVAGALQAAHAVGIVHRDIKPHNILLDTAGQPRVTDFGIAQAAGMSSLTETSVVLGTAAYISPEQAGRGAVDARSDIYSLGVVAYELLAGRPPFEGGSMVELAVQHVNETPRRLRAVRPDISPAAEAVVMRCLEKLPEDRYQSAADLRAAAENALASAGVSASEAETVAIPAGAAAAPTRNVVRSRPDTNGPRRTRYWWAGIAVAAVALIAVLAFIVTQIDVDDPGDTAGPGEEQSELAAPEEAEPAEDPNQDDPANDAEESVDEGGAQTENESDESEDPDNAESEDIPDEGEESVAPETEVEALPAQSGTFTCDGEYAGGTAEAIVVPGNATCTLSGVRVEDDLSIQPGSTLVANDIEVFGNVQAQGVARVEVLGASYIDGNVEFERSGELLLSGATVDGNVIAEDNGGIVSIDGNTVNGNVEVESNRGGVSITGNIIEGDLECEGNDPPPTGGNNTVAEELDGQCRDL